MLAAMAAMRSFLSSIPRMSFLDGLPGFCFWPASGTRGAALCVARSQYTKLKKTGSGPASYGKWALFALKCAWEDRRR